MQSKSSVAYRLAPLLSGANICLVPTIFVSLFLGKPMVGIDGPQSYLLGVLSPIGLIYAGIHIWQTSPGKKVKIVWGLYGVMLVGSAIIVSLMLKAGGGLAAAAFMIMLGGVMLSFLPLNIITSLLIIKKTLHFRVSAVIFVISFSVFVIQCFGYMRPGALE